MKIKFQAIKKPSIIKSFKKISFLLALSFGSLLVSVQSFAATVEYTCNEGIPLIVEFVEENQVAIARVSHDSSPKITLVSVRSGSGAKYSNGNWVLHVKGKIALVGTQGEFDDKCTEVARRSDKTHRPAAITYPREAKSWGGIVRSGPGQRYKKKASLKEGEWIS